MNGKNKRIARNQGTVEFLANLGEIQTMLEQGYNKRNVHGKLLEKGRITMSYYTFCANYTAYNKKKKNLAKPVESPVTLPAAKPPPSSGPRIINTAKEPFPDPRKMSVEDGI